MKRGASVLYLIGAILAGVSALLYLLLGIFGLCGLVTGDFLKLLEDSNPLLKEYPQSGFIAYFVNAAFDVVFLFLALHGRKMVEIDCKKIGFHIFILIAGVLTFNFVAIFAAIFSLIVINNAVNPVVEEAPVLEEPTPVEEPEVVEEHVEEPSATEEVKDEPAAPKKKAPAKKSSTPKKTSTAKKPSTTKKTKSAK